MSLAASIVGQLILALVLFAASGLATANLPTRVASAVLPLLIYPLFFVVRLLTVPKAMDSERLARIAELEQAIDDQKWALIGGDNARRHALLSQFRELYKLDADGVSPELLANLAWPPIEWLNNKLERRGERWRVDRTEEEKVFTLDLEG